MVSLVPLHNSTRPATSRPHDYSSKFICQSPYSSLFAASVMWSPVFTVIIMICKY
ncbi:uncharacterized protein BDW70DRAFT_136810 [Aspergillus foveolatus]|uniref:uncharacterized protein n=1 Tax=Aspergillus foveolatus TaxID=210207 RepID=UPI003CCCE6AE